MSAAEIDAYLATVPEPGRSTLARLRADLRELLPDADEVISYDVPAFKQHGKVVAGFAAFKHHLAYLPHSGSVLPALAGELEKYQVSAKGGSLHFPHDHPLPRALVKQLVDEKIRQLDGR